MPNEIVEIAKCKRIRLRISFFPRTSPLPATVYFLHMSLRIVPTSNHLFTNRAFLPDASNLIDRILRKFFMVRPEMTNHKLIVRKHLIADHLAALMSFTWNVRIVLLSVFSAEY